MDKKEGQTEAEAVVEEALPNTLFRVQYSDGVKGLVYLSGRMRRNRIKVLVGDNVKVEIDPYGGKGRIVKRL
jgi:translation initiation factor IF-1